jgi:hypothetical protein
VQRAIAKGDDLPPWLGPCLGNEHSFWNAAQMARWPSVLNSLAAELRKTEGGDCSCQRTPLVPEESKAAEETSLLMSFTFRR